MELLIDRAELFTLAVLAQAKGIFGLDANLLTPQDPAARQRMYDQGEAKLINRGLLRTQGKSAQLEQSLLKLWQIVVAPEVCILVIRTDPGLERRHFYFYGDSDRFVLQTLPSDRTHQFSTLNGVAALARRIQKICPMGHVSKAIAPFSVPSTSFYALVNASLVADQQAALEALKAVQAEARPAIAALSAKVEYVATLAFYKMTAPKPIEPREIAVWAGDGRALLAVIDARAQAQIGPTDAKNLGFVVGELVDIDAP